MPSMCWFEQSFRAWLGFAILTLTLACTGAPDHSGGAVSSSISGASDTGGGGGGVAPGGSASGGTGGSVNSAAGQSGATAAGGSLVTAGAAGSAGATGGHAEGGGGSGSVAPVLTTKDFECTEVIGLWVASQWWDSFEKGVDNAHWEFTFQHHGYLEMFADPQSPFWGNAVSSKCAANATAPDRVVFLPFSLTLSTLEQWTSNLTQVVETMKGKFPGVKRIELMTTLRGPSNMPCANDTDPNTVVSPNVDQAIQMVADASGGLVTVGPKIELKTCDWWAGGTDLTGAGNTGAGQLLAEYYKTH